MVGRVKGGKSWHERHKRDHGVKKAKQQNYRNRAAIKLLEIDAKFNLLKSKSSVIEIGASPGGWSQVIAPKVKALVACDLLDMKPVDDTYFIQGDFTDEAIQARMLGALTDPVTLICSDMAPNMTGIKIADQENMRLLLESVIAFSDQHLCQNGSLLFKCFESSDIQQAIKTMSPKFSKIHRYKPPTSRQESTEFYLVALKKK